MELYSSQQRSCLAVGRLRLDFIPTPLSSLGSSLKGGREASSDVLPFIAPTRVQLSIERHCWHTVLQPNACACMLIELTAPHIALSISPCHISAIVDIYHAICSSFPPAPTPQDRNSASQTVLPTDTTISGSPAQPLHNSSAPAASATALHFSRDDLRDGGEFNLLPRAGGRAAAFTISQSASGGDEAWISWRYPLPRLVTLVRLGSPEDSTQPASMQHRRQGSFGSADAKAMPYLVELRRWEMMRERFEVVATARLSSLADTCELRAATSQTGGAGPTAGASEWCLAVRWDVGGTGPAAHEAILPTGRYLLRRLRVDSCDATSDLPPLLVRAELPGIEIAVRPSNVKSSPRSIMAAPSRAPLELFNLSLRSARLR